MTEQTSQTTSQAVSFYGILGTATEQTTDMQYEDLFEHSFIVKR